jgi:hypothetical protein
VKRDPLLWAATAAVLVVLASAEYNLGVACGFGTYVAAGVPAALDVYALAALRARRDVFTVVLTLIAVNAASHLVEVGLLPVSVLLVVAVSAVAPLVLWRVHRLSEQADHFRGTAEVITEPAVSAVPETYPPVEVHRDTPVPEPVEQAPSMPVLGPFASLEQFPRITAYPEVYPGSEQDEHERADDAVPARDTPADTADTLPLPPGYTPVEDELTTTARMDFADILGDGRAPSIRSLRDAYSIGQPRAQRIQSELIRA